MVGYVPQDDILPGTSTVWEFLSFHAALRVAGVDAGAQGARVWQVRQPACVQWPASDGGIVRRSLEHTPNEGHRCSS